MFSISLMNFEHLIPSLLMGEGEDEGDILFLHLRDRFGDRFFYGFFKFSNQFCKTIML